MLNSCSDIVDGDHLMTKKNQGKWKIMLNTDTGSQKMINPNIQIFREHVEKNGIAGNAVSQKCAQYAQ